MSKEKELKQQRSAEMTINSRTCMLGRIQKVRDLVERLLTATQIWPVAVNGYIKEASGDTVSFDFVTQCCSEIEKMCNDIIHRDIDFCEYLEVHNKVYCMIAYLTDNNSPVLNEWIAALYNADDACCRSVLNIINI